MTWSGNPTMWWKDSKGRWYSHIVCSNPAPHDCVVLKRAREFAEEHDISSFVLCIGNSICTADEQYIPCDYENNKLPFEGIFGDSVILKVVDYMSHHPLQTVDENILSSRLCISTQSVSGCLQTLINHGVMTETDDGYKWNQEYSSIARAINNIRRHIDDMHFS